MKPFNLQEALAGKPVVMRDGAKAVRIVHIPEANEENRVMAVREGQRALSYYENGHYCGKGESQKDLFMASEKKEGWINVYNTGVPFHGGAIYSSKEEAQNSVDRISYWKERYVDSVRIEWSE